MGPRHWSRGRRRSICFAQKGQVEASMGPRHWSRGRQRCKPLLTARLNSFNGATTLESWKTSDPIGAPLPEGKLQWGHDTGVVEDGIRAGPHAQVDVLQWGHDTGVVEDLAELGSGLLVQNRFNGATTLESWKTTSARAWHEGATLLQWGHDTGVVEDLLPAVGHQRRLGASMGPRHWSRGRRRPCRR